MFIYPINEFSIESDFVLPCDSSAREIVAETDILTMRRASLAHLSCILRKIRPQLIYDVGDGFLLEPHTLNGMLALHIDITGTSMTIDCADHLLEAASAWAIHAGLGVATLTHGGVPLHGAAVEVAGRYVALIADSGVGKSTLSWFLQQRGALFGNDDLIPVRVEGDEAAAFPAVSLYPKLSREAVDRYGLDRSNLLTADYGTGEEEYYVPLPLPKRVTTPRPLAAVFLLRTSPLARNGSIKARRISADISIRRLSDQEAAASLRTNMHALWLIEKWMNARKIDVLCRSLAERIPCYELAYPRAFAMLPHVMSAICQAVG